MERIAESPLATYQAHLDKGELAYQWSPEAGKAVFCPKDEGGAFVADSGIAPKGSLPVNTNGGGLSYRHPGLYGLLLLIEAARQLRHECGARQVADCETAIAHGNGGVLSSQTTVILGTGATV